MPAAPLVPLVALDELDPDDELGLVELTVPSVPVAVLEEQGRLPLPELLAVAEEVAGAWPLADAI